MIGFLRGVAMFVSYNLIFSATIVTVAALALGLRAYLKSEQP